MCKIAARNCNDCAVTVWDVAGVLLGYFFHELLGYCQDSAGILLAVCLVSRRAACAYAKEASSYGSRAHCAKQSKPRSFKYSIRMKTVAAGT